MAVIRRRNKKQFLADIPTLISEEGIDSKYFQIFGMPEELPTGKSSFIVGGSPFLKSGVKLKIEIIDSQGGVVYTEPVYGYRDGVNRRVSIEIYDPKQVGEAILTLLGEIDPVKSDVPIPTEWQGVYNVKYTRRLSINPTLLNVQPIRFHKQPYVNIVPLTNAFKEYIQQPEETRILTAELASSKTAGTSTQTTDVVTQEESYPVEEQAEKAFDYMALYNSPAFKQSSFSNFRMPFTFQSFSPPTGNANLIVSSGSLDDGMIGENIIINDPQVDTTSPDIPTTYTVPSQYSSSILDITNDTTLNLAKAFYVTGDDGSTKYPVNLSSNQSFTCSFSPVPTEQDSVINYFDLADIRLSRLRTFSGDVKYVRVFGISQGSQTEQQFDFLGEFPLESQELLFDYNNIKSGRTGFFFNQSKINSYWNAYGGTRATTASGSGEPANSIQLAQTGSVIRYAMDISGSNADLNQEIMAQTSHSFSLSKNVPYELSFKVYGSRTPKTTSTGDTNTARIDFLISGSDFKPNHEFGGTYGRRILSIDFDDSDEYPELRDLQSYDWNKTYLSGMFIPLTSGVGKLQIRASSGRWHVSDVSLRPAADTNFSPEEARIFSEMPPSRNRPETVKFLLEFVNNDGKKADAVIISPDVVFPGANFAIQGDNNILSGSLFISNAIGEGIEMAGVSSAFLRTIGWEGFISASSGTGKGGFFLYSGSALSDAPDDYMGAGLEIHDGRSGANERYFQFKTQHGASSESIFRVKTDDYLFGISGSGGVESYISGADGNLEVSSSNFSISNTGDVNMSGTVTATSGKIGDWTISSGDIVGSNITMDADSSRIYKTDSNGELDGYYMDFTPGSNYYVRFGSDFAVSSSGTLIASGAKIEGVITASEGYIANWTIGPNTINKLTSGTYTGMSSIGDARFFAGAANLNAGTSSAVFNVKSGGDVTGSQVLFTGGKVGGWTLTDTTLTGGVVTLNSAGSIEVGGLSDATTVATTNSGFFADSSGNVLIKGNVSGNDYLKVSAGGGIDIKSQVFDLATPTMLLDSGTNSGKISLGATPPTAYNSGTGIYIDGTGKLLIGNSGGDRIQFDGSNFTVKVGSLDIDATDIEISSTKASASFGHDEDVGTVIIEGSPARITVVSGSISNTTFRGTPAGGYHGEILKIGDITDNDGGDKFGLVQFDGTGNDFETDRIMSLGDRGNIIAGWQLTTNQIRGIPDAGVGENYADGETKLIIHSGGSIETSDFATGLKGWRISSLGNGTAEFENMRIRGTLRTTVFEKESVNVVGGQLMVANSTTMEPLKDVSGSILAGAASMSATDVTMSVANVSGFSNGEIIKSKKVDDTGFIVEYMLVTGSMRYTAVGSPYSESIRLADMGATDPDGLAGEVYVGRGYGQVNVVSSSIATVDTEIPITGTYGTQANIILDLGANSVVTQSILKINDERFKVVSASSGVGTTGNNQTIKVLRDFLATDPAVHTAGSTVYTVDTDAEFLFGLVSSAQTYNAGQVVVSTGKFDAAKDLSSGYLIMNANPNDTSTPYMDIVERTGSGVYDLQLRARLGDLSGLSSGYLYGDEEPGFGLYTDNGYFRGTIQAMTGSIHGILNIATTAGGIETGDKIMMGRNVAGSSDGIRINGSNYWYTTGAWKVGGATNYLKLDSASGGNIEIKSETFALDATNLELSSTQASMSLGEGKLLLQGASSPYIQVGSSNAITIKTDGTDQYMVMGNKTSFSHEGSGTAGILIGMDGSNPQAEFVRSATDYFLFDGSSGVDIKTGKLLISAGTMTIQANDSGQLFEVGGLSGAGITDASGSETGVYIDSSGNFLAKSGGSGSGYIRAGSSNIDIRSGVFDLQTTGLKLVGTTGTGANNYLALGSATSATVGTGFWADGGGSFRVGEATSEDNYLYFTGTSLTVKAGTFDLQTNTMILNSAGDGGTGTIRLGGSGGPSSPTANTQGIYMDGGGAINIYGDAQNYFRMDGGAVDILTDEITIQTGGTNKLKLFADGTNTPTLAMGATLNTAISGTNKGIYMDGTGDFLLYGSSTNYFKFDADGSSIDIKSDTFDLTTPTMLLDSGTNTAGSGSKISLGELATKPTAYNSGKGIYLEGTGKALIGDAGGNYVNFDGTDLVIQTTNLQVSSTGDVTMRGTVTADAGDVGGFTIAGGKLQAETGGDTLLIQSAASGSQKMQLSDEDGAVAVMRFGNLAVSESLGGAQTFSTAGTTNPYSSVAIKGNCISLSSTTTLNSSGNSGLMEFGSGDSVGTSLTLIAVSSGDITTAESTYIYRMVISSSVSASVWDDLGTGHGTHDAHDLVGSGRVTYNLNIFNKTDDVVVSNSNTFTNWSANDLTTQGDDEGLTAGDWYVGKETITLEGSFTNAANFGSDKLEYQLTCSVSTMDFNNTYVNEGGGGGSFTENATSSVNTMIHSFLLEPNSKVTEVTPRGIQTVHTTTVDSEKYFIVDHTNDDTSLSGDDPWFISSAGNFRHFGNIYASADIFAFYSSDLRLKDNIELIKDPIDKIKQMRGVSFSWNSKKPIPDDFHNPIELGVIAQEVLPAVPEVVRKQRDGYYGVKYEQLIPVLIEGIKEQQKQIEDLQEHAHEPQNYKVKCDEMEERIIELEKKLEVT